MLEQKIEGLTKEISDLSGNIVMLTAKIAGLAGAMATPQSEPKTRKAKNETAAKPVESTPAPQEEAKPVEVDPVDKEETVEDTMADLFGTEEPQRTIEDVRKVSAKLVQTDGGKHTRLIELLAKYNAKKIPEIKADDLNAFYADVEKAIG